MLKTSSIKLAEPKKGVVVVGRVKKEHVDKNKPVGRNEFSGGEVNGNEIENNEIGKNYQKTSKNCLSSKKR